MEKFGLIGHPIAHSASPALFAKAYGGRWQYDLIDGELFDVAWKRFLEGYRAINITAPFKEDAFREVLACGVMDAEVREIGAINIAVKEADGIIHGYNSDYLGVLKVLREHGYGPGSTVVVAGFGGAGKAAAAAARTLGCDVVICNRTRHTPSIRPLEELPVLAGIADILIYTLAFPIPELEDIPSVRDGDCGRDGRAPGGGGFGSARGVLDGDCGVFDGARGKLDGEVLDGEVLDGEVPGGIDVEFGSARGELAILEANYRNPCLDSRPGYIPGTEWHRAQAVCGYPLMTGCPTLPF